MRASRTRSCSRLFALTILCLSEGFALFGPSAAFVPSFSPHSLTYSPGRLPSISPRARTLMTTTMMGKTVDSLVRFAWGYPKFPQDLPGPYSVSSLVRTRVSETSVTTTISYPAEPANPSSSSGLPQTRLSYWSQDQVNGLVDYTRQPKLAPVLSTLRRAWHPSSPVGRMPLSPPDGRGWPVIIFSHGLAGHADMYTDLCRSLSSFGYVVIAMEHEDGSGTYASNKEGEIIRYKRPDNTPYSREKVTRFRAPFLQQRVEETEQILLELETLHANPTSQASTAQGATPAVGDLLRIIDPTSVSLVGHSFGAASSLLATQKLVGREHPFTLTALLDPWAFALPDSVLSSVATPGPDTNVPLFSIISEAWLDSKELFTINTLLQASESAGRLRGSYYAADSVHQSFSDTTTWLPRWMAGRAGLMGRSEVRGSTQRSVAEAIHKQIQAEQERKRTGKTADAGRMPEQLRQYEEWKGEGEGVKLVEAASQSAQT